MASTSPNLSLRLPEGSDTVDVTLDITNNMTKIDNTAGVESPQNFSPSDSASAGSSTRFAKADHKHGSAGFGAPVDVGTANSEGDSTSFARSNHVHKATPVWINHIESFDIQNSGSEDVDFYAPSAPTAATLILRGRSLLPGLLPAHIHTVTIDNSTTNHTHSGTTDNDAGLTVNSDGAHTHSGSSVETESAHTHPVTVNTGSNHNHGINSDGTHDHNLHVDSGSEGAIQIDVGAGYSSSGTHIDDGGSHSHGGNTQNEGSHTHGASSDAGAGHTHSLTIASDGSHNHSIDSHNHAFTSGNESVAHDHTGTISSTGSGGFTSTSIPNTVTVEINGVDRTSALGGPFGDTVSWNETALNILPYITTSGFHTVTIGATTGGRLKVQILMSL